MDKKELVKKIVESAIARGGVFLEDSMLGNAVEGILDDYPVIGDANRGDWDWWGSAHADMAQFDNADESTGTNMSASINAYGEEWAGDGKIAVVAYAWTPNNSTDTEQLLGKAVFDYATVRELTMTDKVSCIVEKLVGEMDTISGVMCDPVWRRRLLSTVVRGAPTNRFNFSVVDDKYTLKVVNEPNIPSERSNHVRVTVTMNRAADSLIGSVTFAFNKFWSILLDD